MYLSSTNTNENNRELEKTSYPTQQDMADIWKGLLNTKERHGVRYWLRKCEEYTLVNAVTTLVAHQLIRLKSKYNS